MNARIGNWGPLLCYGCDCCEPDPDAEIGGEGGGA